MAEQVVHIVLRSVIQTADDSDTIVQHIDGTLSAQPDGCVLRYREPDAALDNTRTVVTVTANGITIDRRGAYVSCLRLLPSQATPFRYDTPYGRLELTAQTRRINNTLTADGGRLAVEYTLTDQGGQVTAYSLTLLVRRLRHTVS